MEVFLRHFVMAGVALAFLMPHMAAKRMPPRQVAPVVADGVQYCAGGDGRNQYVVAKDAASEKELWRVKVFTNHIKRHLEEDVQWIFIRELKIAGDSLLVRDERA